MATATLINTLNRKRAKVKIEIPAMAACYAQHDELLKWSKKTGCVRMLKKMWDGADVEPFIEIVGEWDLGFAVYRNPRVEFYSSVLHRTNYYYSGYVKDTDERAFWAMETGEADAA